MKKFLISLGLICAPLFLLAYTSPGSPTGFVDDFAGLFSATEKVELEQTLVNFEKESSNEIAVVTIKTLGDETIETYAIKLFEEWKIGKANNDNGVLVLIALEERKMRIEVGYGLEGALTDALSSNIIRNVMTPAFREEKYFEGVKGAVDAIISATKGEYVPVDQGEGLASITWEALGFLIFVVPIGIASILGRSKSWWAGGVIGGAGGIVLGIIFGFFFVGIISIPLLIVIGLIFDYIVSKGYQRGVRSGHIPWWVGGGKSGGGSFGGFGGGSSGGGGASGGW